jgi:acetyltransferase-like isoleucine patch superfamily enzyme
MNFTKIKKGICNPFMVIKLYKKLLRGYYYKLKYTLFQPNVKIGKNFKVTGKFSIRGPGKIRIGDNVFADGTSHAVTPWTYNKDAVISIGNDVFLNGTRFGCQKKIEIGDNCLIADCRILDTDFHSTNPNRRNDPDAIKSDPIFIGKNVWISLDSVVLRGASIGDNSTISAKSVVTGIVPGNCIFGGNPAVLIKKLNSD